MRILVTGAGGFVGRHLCRYLAAIGDSVIALAGPKGVNSLDVTDAKAVEARIALEQPEGIVHLAGVSSVAWSHTNPTETFLVNVVGTVNVLQAVRNMAPTARLLIIGSGEMYGKLVVGHRAREDTLLRPLSPYAASKCSAEQVALQFAASYGTRAVCARPFNHVGTGQALSFVVPSFARQIAEAKAGLHAGVIEVGDVSPIRDFLHIEDVVQGYRLLLECGETGTSYNLCSGEPLAIRDVLEALLRIADLRLEVRVEPSRFRPVEIPWLVGDNSRVRMLGWTPRHTVQSALSEALAEQVSSL